MSASGVKSLIGFVLFTIVKHSPNAEENLTRILLAPNAFNEIPLVTWYDIVMGLWIFSDKILLMIPVYLLASLVLPSIYLRFKTRE